MSQSSVQITKQFDGDTWVVLAEVLPGGPIPSEIFTYENTGTSELGTFKGVCSVDELNRFQKWNGEVIRKFGNKYVRYGQAKIIVPQGTDPDTVIAGLVDSIKFLSNDLKRASEVTTVITI